MLTVSPGLISVGQVPELALSTRSKVISLEAFFKVAAERGDAALNARSANITGLTWPFMNASFLLLRLIDILSSLYFLRKSFLQIFIIFLSFKVKKSLFFLLTRLKYHKIATRDAAHAKTTALR